ncbi:ribonuclease M5 [Seinonella peptonophila]|uniref:Ribonuclease M5 n=1 Tax=Seinonella peptonophila TaxID=112248 RepID=A0A1M4YLI8_9BACL|nr:ribonuclease M5 [Seinonella peptonophila]SHF06659.1 ribonuclease M5 [Seinonella peptonophila]
MKAKIQEVIVVEGLHDTQAVQRAVDADTIETGGSAIGESVLFEISRAQRTRGVIIFTDPDSAGERIRRIISEHVPGVKHAFLSREAAKGKRKIGVEHASDQALRHALASVRTEQVNQDAWTELSWSEYVAIGLIGRADSAQLREQLADELDIGYANGKRFFHRLQVLRIQKEELTQALERVKR